MEKFVYVYCVVVVQRYWGFGRKVLMVNDKFVLVDFFFSSVLMVVIVTWCT
jgi:hypothetical protein